MFPDREAVSVLRLAKPLNVRGLRLTTRSIRPSCCPHVPVVALDPLVLAVGRRGLMLVLQVPSYRRLPKLPKLLKLPGTISIRHGGRCGGIQSS
jgi:hypothetical protein